MDVVWSGAVFGCVAVWLQIMWVGLKGAGKQTQESKKVAQFTRKHSLQVFNKHTFAVTSVHVEVVEGSDETN